MLLLADLASFGDFCSAKYIEARACTKLKHMYMYIVAALTFKLKASFLKLNIYIKFMFTYMYMHVSHFPMPYMHNVLVD